MTRRVILHHHFFKNAGTSVDQFLVANFPGRWVSREFAPAHPVTMTAAVGEWIRDTPEAIAFSSHTAPLLLPEIEGVEIFPVVFLRHPIDRIASAYRFERQQGESGHDSYGAVVARHTTLAGYVDIRLAFPHDRQCRNFHVARLATRYPDDPADELERARRALDELRTRGFVGRVEEFASSLGSMGDALACWFQIDERRVPDVNRSLPPTVSLPDRLAGIARALGEPLATRLMAANRDDLELLGFS